MTAEQARQQSGPQMILVSFFGRGQWLVGLCQNNGQLHRMECNLSLQYLILVFQYQSQFIRYYQFVTMSRKRTLFYVWGSGSHGQLGLIDTSSPCKSPQPCEVQQNVKRIACGQKHVLFVNDEGICFSQGSNQNGQLGIDNKELQFSSVPLIVQLPGPVCKVYCGLSYSFALLENKEIYGWGLNEQGILGSSNTNISWKPIKLNIDKTHKIKTISCGALHCGFVTEEGDVLMCGSNEYGQLGFNRREKVSSPTSLNLSSTIIDVACGVFYTLLLDNHGKVYSFGNNKYGQLGTGSKQSQFYPKKIKALENEYIVKISSGYHSGALTNRGELFIWGSGTFGEYLLPHRIELPNGNFYVEFCIGGFFGAAVDKYGKVHTWGNNVNGQLGQGHLKSLKCPTQIHSLKNVEKVYCGNNFVIAISRKSNCRSVSTSQKPFIPELQSNNTPSRHSRSIQKAVSNFKKTVNELQSKEMQLSLENSELQQKLFSLSEDYAKLSQRYQLIEKIVGEKQRVIAIYQEQIKQSNIRLVESSSTVEKYQVLTQQNARLSEKAAQQYQQLQQCRITIDSLRSNIESLKRKNDHLVQTTNSLNHTNEELNQMCESLKQSNESLKHTIQTLKLSQRQLKLEIKNQKHLELEQGVEEVIKAKDVHIEELIKSNQRLANQVARADERLREETKYIEELEGYKAKVNQLELILMQREDEINQLYQQKEGPKNIRKFTGFMCSPSERSDSKQRTSPIKLHYENRPTSTQQQPNNPLELKRTIRCMSNQIIYLTAQLQAQKQSEMKLQRQIQQQMLISAKLKQDIRELQGSLTLTESENTNSKQLLSKYQTIISVKEQEYEIDKGKIEKMQEEYKGKELMLRSEIKRLKEEGHDLRERISIIQEREKDSMNIIRAQKRQIQDLRALEVDIDSRTLEYKKLLIQISDKNVQIESLREKASEKKKQLKQLQQILGLEREQYVDKMLQIEKQLSRVTEIKERLYQNANDLYSKNAELQSKVQVLQMEENKSKYLMVKLQEKLEEARKQAQQHKEKVQQLELQICSLKKEVNLMSNLRNEVELAYQESSILFNNTLEEKEEIASKYKQTSLRLRQMTAIVQNKTEQIADLKGVIAKKEKDIQQMQETIEELEEANREYTSNEGVLIARVKELEKHATQLEVYVEDVDRKEKQFESSYRELDRKNRQLADMLNKAIEQQATEYKQRIMTEVAHNATVILENFQDKDTVNEKKPQKPKEKESISGRQFGLEITNFSPGTTTRAMKSPPKHSGPQQTPEQKYNKILTLKILQNKKKISESASKLCELLDFRQGNNEQIYTKINSKIESMDEQKEMLMSKLCSYVEKLKQL